MKGLDFETFCRVDLKTRGLDNYIKDPSFRPLIASVARRVDGRIVVDRFDFITGARQSPDVERRMFGLTVRGEELVAHNAGFERAVLGHMNLPVSRVIDSAVISRAVGAGERLEAAAPQLLGVDKMEDGRRLIKKFCMPQENGYVYIDHVEDWTQQDWDDWETFGEYCDLDAELSFRIVDEYPDVISDKEWANEAVTQAMNDAGWFVDLDLIERMIERRDLNLAQLERDFRRNHDPEEKLNFRSTPQLQKWCAERGIKAQSFDELHVAKLLVRVTDRISAVASGKVVLSGQSLENLLAVRDMLITKQELGGSSLSKLETIQRLVGPDGRLRGQYLHIGAGQTFRTSGRGAQLQNLKRLGKNIGDVSDVSDWDNAELARNLRQAFIAEHPDGEYIVGDFSSVESRGLAYQAGARWKLAAYKSGKDLYKVLASSMLGVPYDSVDAGQRQTGKVGELSCGYGAGPKAVKDFAEKMGVTFTLEEAGDTVVGWRDTNPEVVSFWKELDHLLHMVVEEGKAQASMLCGPSQNLNVRVRRGYTPDSLRQQKPGAQTISVSIHRGGDLVLQRWFQGCFMEGRDVCYHKPSELKGGKLWLERWSKNGQSGRYKIYGGKLAGILTQSLCREIFFNSLRHLQWLLSECPNARIVGQFHDEIVVEWWPAAGGWDKKKVVDTMATAMTEPRSFHEFPLAAEIKSAHRYIK